MMTWKEQLDNNPLLKNFDSWPIIIISDLDKAKRKDFNRNRQIVALALKGDKFDDIAYQFSVDRSFIYYLLKRSLSSNFNSPPPLTKALVPGFRLKSGLRNKPLSNLTNKNSTRGSFNYLLSTVPGLSDQLDKVIINHLRRTKHGQNLKPSSFHAEFIRYLREKNWCQNTYPFNQDKLGYESARKYFHQRLNELSIPNSKPKKVVSTIKQAELAYQEIQIDAQLQDVSTSIYIDFDGDLIPHRISRVSLYLAKDVSTDCILSYHLCLTKDPTQLDLLTLLEGIHQPWRPLQLTTPGLQYEPGACLPSSLSSEFTKVGLGVVKLDNALCHLSHMVRDYICDAHGATLNLGLPAQPKGRNFVEYAFRLLSAQNNRFASTTGSHPKDPIKETKKNSKSAPILTLNAFEEILSVLITSHNLRPQERLSGSSPLHLIQHQMANSLIRLSYDFSLKTMSPFTKRKKVNLIRYKHEGRDPFIYFMGCRYNGQCLRTISHSKKCIQIEYDARDIRKLNAFTSNGRYLGELYAPKSWQRFSHSIDTRRRINKLTKQQRIKKIDPLAGYFSYLLENKSLPKNKLEIIKVYREFQLSKHSIVINQPSKNSTPKIRATNGAKIPKWTPNLFQEHRSSEPHVKTRFL